MVCESFTGGVFAYLSQLCNDLCGEFDIYLAYSIRIQTPKNYRDFLDKRIHLIEIENFGKGILNIYNDMKVIQKLRALDKEIKPDIIHLHSSIAGGLGRLAYGGRNGRVIYTPHGYAHIVMMGSRKSVFYKNIEKLLGKIKATTLTCCESEDEEARKLSRNTAYIETGINLKDLAKSLDGIVPRKNDTFTVYSLGRVCHQKQPQLFNRIAELVPEANFIWIGGGELEEQLTSPNIQVTGWKPRKEALEIAKGADAFILCSLGEAIAMSLLENMYIEKLSLVSNAMGNKSVIQNGVNGYVCTTAEEYAAYIREAQRNYPTELVKEAKRQIYTIYNTETMKQKYIEFYNRIFLGG